jgi:hypothetical protein
MGEKKGKQKEEKQKPAAGRGKTQMGTRPMPKPTGFFWGKEEEEFKLEEAEIKA